MPRMKVATRGRLKSNMDMFAVRGDPWNIPDRPPEQIPPPGIYTDEERAYIVKLNRAMRILGKPERCIHLLPASVARALHEKRKQANLIAAGDPDTDRWTEAGYKSPKKQRKKASNHGKGFLRSKSVESRSEEKAGRILIALRKARKHKEIIRVK